MILSPTTDTTGNGRDTTAFFLMETTASDSYDRYNKNVSRNALRSAAVTAVEATDTIDTTLWKPKILNSYGLCLRCRELVSHDRNDRYNRNNYMEIRLKSGCLVHCTFVHFLYKLRHLQEIYTISDTKEYRV